MRPPSYGSMKSDSDEEEQGRDVESSDPVFPVALEAPTNLMDIGYSVMSLIKYSLKKRASISNFCFSVFDGHCYVDDMHTTNKIVI